MTRTMMVTRCVRLFLFSFLCWVMNSPEAWAQLTTTGTLSGRVTDSRGAVVPQAAITVSSEDTKVETHTTSNGDGSFVLPGLPPGGYDVTIVKQGFETYTESGILLSPAQVATVNAMLTVGQVSTSVTVHGSAAQVQTTTAEVSNQVNEQQVSTLPLNGRNYQSLSFLMPGVTNTSPDTALAQGGFLTNNVISVNGGGIEGTQYYLDGIWNENGNFKQTAITPNPDSIEEVRLLQNNYGAQYALNGPNVMLLETKSGTHEFHGTAFEYLRNNALDARNYFSPTVSPLHQNIYGFTLGGPLFIPRHYNTKKDKTFFFWSEQWVRQDIGNVLRGADPTAAQRMGSFATPIKDPLTGMDFPQNQIPQNRLNAGSLSFLNVTVPLPNYPAGGFLNYVNTTPTINNQRDDEIKVDQNIGAKLRLMGEYLAVSQTNGNSTQTLIGSPYSTTGLPIITNNELAQLRLTQLISSSMVNTTSYSASIYNVSLTASGIQYQSQIPGLNEVLPYPIPARGGGPADRLPMIIFGGGYPILGLTYILPVHNASNAAYTLSDDWSWLRGKHYLQAGAQWIHGTDSMTAFAATAGEWVFTGAFTGNAMADFLLGDGTQLMQVNNEFRSHQRYPIVSPYFQDQWKVTSKLTLTLGLRYTYSPNVKFIGSQARLYSNFIPSRYDPSEAPIVNLNGSITATPNYNPNNGIALLGTPGAPFNLSNEHNNYWNPTAGFAFDPFGNGKTSIRGGYGLYHYQMYLVTDCGFNCLNNPPSIQNTTLVAPAWPDSTGGHPAPLTVPSLGGQFTNLKEPTIHSYSLGVQRQFGDWIVSVAGAGNIVKDQTVQGNINQPVPEGGFDFNPLINPGNISRYASSLAGPAPYIGYGAVTMYQNLANSNWNALEVNVKHPVGHGVFFSAAYTWQHGLSMNRGINGYFTGSSVQDIYHPSNDYGTSNTNVGQVLAISLIWKIPLFNEASGLKKTLLGGWSYSDVTSIQGGFALDPGLATGNPGLATRPNRVAGTGIGGPKTVAAWFNKGAFVAPAAGFFGTATTGTITGPGVVDFDMALYKDFAIKERYTFQFRSEFFNALNHTNFSGVSTSVGAGNYGQVTSALDPRIIELALRFQF
jgi:Carboxypeptidase regulatory-like domain